ncbi:hypothetical protein H4Q26_015908 [Puccinia striiformis f. sp. tritici PST-130]|nr:hypothetical protein H4Q26_015908 [Puccinia striiformis f. sp. tritici PST-130]
MSSLETYVSVEESLVLLFNVALLIANNKTVLVEGKNEYVEGVIQFLESEDLADAVIGFLGFGLGVEARKRLTIGVELAAPPELLLFLDEPTSGMDGQSAFDIFRFLRKLAGAGQAILCTIHQSNALLFENFDRLLLLKKGGRCVYFGDIVVAHKSNLILVAVFCLFCGVTIPKANIPRILEETYSLSLSFLQSQKQQYSTTLASFPASPGMYDLNPVSRVVSGLIANEMHGLEITCAPEE